MTHKIQENILGSLLFNLGERKLIYQVKIYKEKKKGERERQESMDSHSEVKLETHTRHQAIEVTLDKLIKVLLEYYH